MNLKLNIKHSFYLLLTFFLFGCNQKEKIKTQPFAIVIHGGAGTILPENMTVQQKKQYKTILEKAINKGYAILENEGSSLTAVQKTLNILEDSPLFNAGKGSVFNNQGKNKMDASIMDGKTLNSGAVAGVSNIKNPINLARVVMDSTKHVLLSGRGAEIFAEQNHVKFESDAYFYTKKSNETLLNAQKRALTSSFSKVTSQSHFGTVGAVALDKYGNIAAATSTGGLTNKKYGRIGDSPIIGAGTYANNKTCGVSCTGIGEYFIRTLAAHEVSSLIQYKNLSVAEAAKEVIHNQIATLGGFGGIVVLDKNGNIAWDFNTKGMFRASKKANNTIIEMFNIPKHSKE